MMKPCYYFTALACTIALADPAAAEDFARHTGMTTGLASDVRPIMSFDSKSCLPIAAVDADGKQNGGLASTGASNGECRTPGNTQAYVRWSCKKHGTSSYCGIVYAFYFEKDQPELLANFGHRHDWEHVIMWTKDKIPEFMTISSHAKSEQFDLRDSYPGDSWSSDLRNSGGKRFKVRYWRTDGSYSTNSFAVLKSPGADFSEENVHYTNWDQLDSAQQSGIAGNWGRAVPRIDDAHFAAYLTANTPADFEPVQ